MQDRINYVLYYAIIVSLGGFVFGFDAAVISGVVGFVTTEFDLTPIQAGFVVALRIALSSGRTVREFKRGAAA